jgi:hypothetical protein
MAELLRETPPDLDRLVPVATVPLPDAEQLRSRAVDDFDVPSTTNVAVGNTHRVDSMTDRKYFGPPLNSGIGYCRQQQQASGNRDDEIQP